MRIGRTKPLRFAPLWLPGIDARGQPSQVDVIVTLKRSRLHPRARLQLTIDGVALPAIDPPDDRDGIWQSEPLRLQPEGPVVAVELAITGGGNLLRGVSSFCTLPKLVCRTCWSGQLQRRTNAIGVLGRLRHGAAIPVLVPRLDDVDHRVRLSTVRALAELRAWLRARALA